MFESCSVIVFGLLILLFVTIAENTHGQAQFDVGVYSHYSGENIKLSRPLKPKSHRTIKPRPHQVNQSSWLDNGIECGINDYNNVRIRGGKLAKEGAHPWIARLIKSGTKDDVACGGSIISRDFVLTAAHCAHLTEKIVIGDYNRTKLDKFENIVSIKDKYVHPRYDSYGYGYDLALLKLAEPIEWNRFVRPICLPDLGSDLKLMTNLTVAGFGFTEKIDKNTGKEANALMVANIPLVSEEVCHEQWPDGHEFDIMYCAGKHKKDGKLESDACDGDSGGPASIQVKNRWTVFGVVAFGDSLCQWGYGAYTKVPYFLDWIRETVTEGRKKTKKNEKKGDDKRENMKNDGKKKNSKKKNSKKRDIKTKDNKKKDAKKKDAKKKDVKKKDAKTKDAKAKVTRRKEYSLISE